MNIELFKQWLTLNCDNLNTINTYYGNIKRILLYCENNLTQEKINNFFIKLLDENKKARTFNSYINSLKKYFIFTNQVFILPNNKTIDKRINKYFTREDVQKDILPYLSQICPNNYLQAELVIKLLLLTAIRKEELLKLKRININFEKMEIELLNTKGNKDRLIPLEKILLKQIKDYFDSNIEVNNAFNITESQINYIFKKINKELNLKNKINSRMCRHSSAVDFLRQGLDISIIQKILGHKDIKTTMIYSEPDFKLVKEAYKNKVKGF